MKLTVIIPIYNEKDTCQSLIKKVQLVPIEKQVIVVDDSSTDGSREILEKIDDIELLKHDGTLGKGSAIQTARFYSAKNVYICKGFCGKRY